MATNQERILSKEEYKGMTIITLEDPEGIWPSPHRWIVQELHSIYNRPFTTYDPSQAKRAITRALHGTLKDHTIVYQDHSVCWDPVAQVYYIYSPKGTLYGSKKTFDVAKEAIDKQLKITSQDHGHD